MYQKRQYNTEGLTLSEKRELLLASKALCGHWWVDELDCSKSLARKKIEMDFEQALEHLSESCHFCVIEREGFLNREAYIEVGFSTINAFKPDIFLFIELSLDKRYLFDKIRK